MRSGELSLARAAASWIAAAAIPASLLALALRGAEAATSVALAAAIVLGNVFVAAALSGLAGRFSAISAAMVALPSFALRMTLMFSALVALKGRPFLEETVFALAFGVAVMLSGIAEARRWARTPWIAMTLKETP